MVTSAGLTTLCVGIGPGVGPLAHLVTTRFPGGGQEWPWCHMAGVGWALALTLQHAYP